MISYTISTRNNRSRMIIDFHKNISKSDLVDNLNKAGEALKEWINEPKDATLWKKCKRLLFNKVEFFDQHGDNFVKNEVMCRAEFKLYKISRVVKNMIARKLCQTKGNI